jgi:hypothetical protein
MWAKGTIMWSVILLVLYRAAPRIAPQRPTLARFGIGSFGLVLPDALYSWLTHRPAGYNPNQGALLSALDAVALVGIFIALICGAVVLFADARSSPSQGH